MLIMPRISNSNSIQNASTTSIIGQSNRMHKVGEDWKHQTCQKQHCKDKAFRVKVYVRLAFHIHNVLENKVSN
ncbi:hypothetical protein Tsubulata_038021 [Turnera subulata]|uniref:Uncharacterized protein n=1 Tax=Turnera subulata TaxID=218843 RepID=A0A9Q0GET7_9ROSI|nr:hypothetical protein Tsubulata_038021 [Turnera subulata]